MFQLWWDEGSARSLKCSHPFDGFCRAAANPKTIEAATILYSNGRSELCNEVETVNAALTKMPPTSGIVPRIDAELFHSGKESRSVYAHARGGAVGAANTSPRFSECAHNRVALILCPLMVHATVGM